MTFFSEVKYLHIGFIILMLTLGYLNVSGQSTPTIFDCFGAKPICAQIYKEDFFPRGVGNFIGEFNPEFSCMAEDDNAVWYTFITHRSGNLGFQITPDESFVNLNWALFDITNDDCRDIFSNPSMQLSCNAASGDACNGRTGADNSMLITTQEGFCNTINPDNGLETTSWNAFIPVEANSIYALMISDATGTSTGGFEIDFGLSDDVMLPDNTKPEIRVLRADKGIGCIPNKIFVRFTENIRCQTISRSNFKLTDDRGREYLVDLDSGSCNLNGEYDRSYVLALLETLPVGRTFLLEIEPSMSHPIVDLCGNTFNAHNFSFETIINEIEEINLPADSVTCESMLTLDVSDPNATDYLWSDGSTNKTLDITSNGLYHVTISNACDRVQTSINVSFMDNSDIDFTLGRDTVLCSDEPYLLSSNLNENSFLYEWDDGETKPIKEVTESGTYTLQITNACGLSFLDSIKVDFQNIDLELATDTTLCADAELTLDVTNPNAMNYQWSTGATTPMIEVIEGGTYNVLLSNECETVTHEINIEEFSCDDCRFYIPNTVSKSAQGINNQFLIQSNCRLESYHLSIYNRWGSLIFDSSDQTETWNTLNIQNEKSSAAIYAYQLRFSFIENSNLINKKTQGSFLLVD